MPVTLSGFEADDGPKSPLPRYDATTVYVPGASAVLDEGEKLAFPLERFAVHNVVLPTAMVT